MAKKSPVTPKPVTPKSAPAPKPAASAPVAVTPKAEASAKKPSRNIGLKTGLHIMEYQDQSFATNEKRQRTDAELGKEWAAEFPNSTFMTRCATNPEIIRGVRSAYNRGIHTPTQNKTRPEVQSHAWIVNDQGQRVQMASIRATARVIQGGKKAAQPAVKPAATVARTVAPSAVKKVAMTVKKAVRKAS